MLQVQAINLLQSLEPPEGEAGNAPLPANTIEPDIRSAVYASAARNGYWVRTKWMLGSVLDICTLMLPQGSGCTAPCKLGCPAGLDAGGARPGGLVRSLAGRAKAAVFDLLQLVLYSLQEIYNTLTEMYKAATGGR